MRIVRRSERGALLAIRPSVPDSPEIPEDPNQPAEPDPETPKPEIPQPRQPQPAEPEPKQPLEPPHAKKKSRPAYEDRINC